MAERRVPVDVRPGEVDTVVAVATALDRRSPELVRDISDAIAGRIPEVRDDERLLSALAASIEANVVTILHVLQGAASIEEAEAPPAALGYARRLAQRGISQVALMRTYRLGHACFLRWCLRELDAQERGDDAVAATNAIVDVSFRYIDRVVEQVATAYEIERDRWSRNRGAAQRATVRQLLAGEAVDMLQSERLLDYRLEQPHVGVVVWCGRAPEHDALVDLERAVDRYAIRSGATAVEPLFIPVDESTAWAWIAANDHGGNGAVGDRVSGQNPATRFAIGGRARGLDGFRQTHREAARAHRVALYAGDHAPSVVRFDEVAPIAALSTDLDFARAWVRTTLGALATADRTHERLRETALVFLRNGSSFTAAAELLHVHKNTVHYRIQQAEEALGRPLRDTRIELELALLACHWMRDAVLGPG